MFILIFIYIYFLNDRVFYNPEFESNISFTPLKKASNIQSV